MHTHHKHMHTRTYVCIHLFYTVVYKYIHILSMYVNRISVHSTALHCTAMHVCIKAKNKHNVCTNLHVVLMIDCNFAPLNSPLKLEEGVE